MLHTLTTVRTFMPKTILVTGSNGQLGSEINALISNDEYSMMSAKWFFTDRSTLDITDAQALESFCTKNDINIIVNCAAYTAVDKAEEDEANADAINHLAVKYMAEVAKKKNIKLIHISTDYVFDGTNHKPYTEEDKVCPVGVYGQTKLLGEEASQSINPEGAIIIRTSWVYSSFGNNFVKTMLRLGKERDELGVIFDQVGTPTYAKDLAQAILDIIQHSKLNIQNSVEIYHYSNEGVCSWYDFALAIFEIQSITCHVNPIETKAYPTPATRPYYSLLNKTKIKENYTVTTPYWRDSLRQALQLMEPTS